MEKLTQEQVDRIIEWLNTWESIRNTAIPIRFKEDFKPEKTNQKPLIVIPKHIHDKMRKCHLMTGIIRYADSGKNIPEEWVTEYNELLKTTNPCTPS